MYESEDGLMPVRDGGCLVCYLRHAVLGGHGKTLQDVRAHDVGVDEMLI